MAVKLHVFVGWQEGLCEHSICGWTRLDRVGKETKVGPGFMGSACYGYMSALYPEGNGQVVELCE